MASTAVEEYLQAIYTLADESGHVVSARLAEVLGFSAPAVSEMVHRLERDGLVTLDGHKEVHLTKTGKAQADSIVRRHRLPRGVARPRPRVRVVEDPRGGRTPGARDVTRDGRADGRCPRQSADVSARQSDAGRKADPDPTTGATHERRTCGGRADTGPVRARTWFSGVPRHAGRAPRGDARDDRAASGAAPRGRRRRGAFASPRLRAEGLGRAVTEAKIYAAEAQPGYFLAIIPILPGCVASGKTRDEAEAKARRAFYEYRALLEAHGVAIDHWKDIDPETLPVGELETAPLVPGEDQPFEEHEIRDFLHQYEASRAAV